MAKLKTYLIMPSRNSKQSFFHKRCVILVISTKFQWIPLQIVAFSQTSGTSVGQLAMRKKSYKSKYLFLRFSKCNETSPKVSFILKRPAVQWCMEKIQLLPMKKCKGFRIKTARTYVEAIARQIGKIMAKLKTYLIMPFPETPNKVFLTNDAWFWSFLQSFQWIPLQNCTFSKTFR